MPFLSGFGLYLPSRVVTNDEMGARAGCAPEWIESVSGIVERRFAAEGETVEDMGAAAARDCLERAQAPASRLGLILVSSGTAGRRFPGPAAGIAHQLGLEGTPAIDLPLASAGSLFGLSLASQLADSFGDVLVIGAEKMSSVVLTEPLESGVAVLFGDGAGACLVSSRGGAARVVDSVLRSDGAFAGDLRLEFGQPLFMNGRSVILNASRKVPRAILEVLDRHGLAAADVGRFLMHQANRNLIARIAGVLGVAEEKFFANIRCYGNTSSASLLIAAAEWERSEGFQADVPVCFAAFGAGFHWGALLTVGAG